MRDWKSLVGLLLVFALGVLAGVFLSLGLVHHRVAALLRPGSLAYEQMVERRLSRGLHLNEDQRAKLHDTLVENLEARKKLQAQIQPQVQSLNLETRHEIRSILTPEQMVTFRRNMEEFRRRFGTPGVDGRARNETAGDTNDAPPIGTTNVAPEAN